MFLENSRTVEKATQGCDLQVPFLNEGREAERKPRGAAKSVAAWFSRYQPKQPSLPSLLNPRSESGTDGGESPSSSKSHNSDASESCSQKDLPFHLTGSQKKTAYCLRENATRLCNRFGFERIGFATFTVGDMKEGRRFEQVWEATEASDRFNNLARRILPEIFARFVVVTERHKNKAIHFHLIGALRSGADIRTGFDFESFRAAKKARSEGWIDHAAERRYKRAAAPALRALWAFLLRKLPGYGFGRSELTPIEKCGEAVASYVAKYVEKNLFNRLAEDKGKKLVRYGGWDQSQLRPNDISWATPKAIKWRLDVRTLAGMLGISEKEDMAKVFGCRWAFKVSKIVAEIERSPWLQNDVALLDRWLMAEAEKAGGTWELEFIQAGYGWDARQQVREWQQPEFEGMPQSTAEDWQWN